MAKYTRVIILISLSIVIGISCSSSSTDPSDGENGSNGPPAGYVAYANMSGFFGDDSFALRKEDYWDTYITNDQTFCDWDGNSAAFCVQLPIGYGSDISLPLTWNVRRGGYCHDDNSTNVSIEARGHSSPPGYDAFLAVTGQFTLTEYNPAIKLFKGSFHFVIGAFRLENGFQYGGDEYYDTSFTNGTFDYSFSGGNSSK